MNLPRRHRGTEKTIANHFETYRAVIEAWVCHRAEFSIGR